MKGWVEWFKEIDSGDIAEFNYKRIAWIKIAGLAGVMVGRESQCHCCDIWRCGGSIRSGSNRGESIACIG